MKSLRAIRILLAILFFAAAVGYAFFPVPVHPVSSLVPCTQIVPSMIATSFGAIIFWLIVTVALGRVYCASFCPIGAIQDGIIWLRRKTGRDRRKRGYHPHRNLRYQLLLVYVACLLTGFLAVSYVVEPWNIFCNIASAVNPLATEATWVRLGVGTATGIVAGIVSLVLICLYAWFADRDFCNVVCPIGTIMGLAESRNILHIEIDPDKCINCLKCEDECPSACIKVVSRYVDNSRCVRCFDCINTCPNDAIRYQANRNRPATPLGKRVKRMSGT